MDSVGTRDDLIVEELDSIINCDINGDMEQ